MHLCSEKEKNYIQDDDTLHLNGWICNENDWIETENAEFYLRYLMAFVLFPIMLKRETLFKEMNSVSNEIKFTTEVAENCRINFSIWNFSWTKIPCKLIRFFRTTTQDRTLWNLHTVPILRKNSDSRLSFEISKQFSDGKKTQFSSFVGFVSYLKGKKSITQTEKSFFWLKYKKWILLCNRQVIVTDLVLTGIVRDCFGYKSLLQDTGINHKTRRNSG